MTNIQLPNNVHFTSYDLHIFPNMDTFEFNGHVDIYFRIVENTDSIVLNMKDLHINSTYVTLNNNTVVYPINSIIDQDTEQIKFIFQQNVLNTGITGKISITFNGTVNDKMVGLYKSKYNRNISNSNDNTDKYCLVTQFEPTGARRMFPCADNPSLKATFNIKISVPSSRDLTVLSNTSVKNIIEHPKIKTYVFNTTPIMSTYLLAIFIGRMDYIETQCIMPNNNTNIKLRVYTPLGEQNSGRFSL